MQTPLTVEAKRDLDKRDQRRITAVGTLILLLLLACSFDHEERRFTVDHLEHVMIQLQPWSFYARVRGRWEELRQNLDRIHSLGSDNA